MARPERSRRIAPAPTILALLAVLALAPGAPGRAQAPDCECAGLGTIDLADPGSGRAPLDYRPVGSAADPAVTAQIRLSCRPSDTGGTRCRAEVDATITEQGASRIGAGSGSAAAPVDACLVLGQVLETAWREAVGPDLPVLAPGPCS